VETKAAEIATSSNPQTSLRAVDHKDTAKPRAANDGRGIFPLAGKEIRLRQPGEDSRMPRKEHPKAEEKPAEQEATKDFASHVPPESEHTSEALASEGSKDDETEELRRRNAELLDKLVRLQAEFENLQKRTARERQEFISYAQEGILKAMLPLLDDFDKAVELIGEKDGGVGLLRMKLVKILEDNGLSEIPAAGQKFDPFLHDAVQFVSTGEKADGTIVEVVRKGYRCNIRVLRPSLVVVVKNEGENNA